MKWEATNFSNIEGWPEDDHRAAFGAFLRTCEVIQRTQTIVEPWLYRGVVQRLKVVSNRALYCLSARHSAADARSFFETYFTPFALNDNKPGFMTGYYEPILLGARQCSDEHSVAIYRRPLDLVNLTSDVLRGHLNKDLTAARQMSGRSLVPYFTRAEIENGSLADRNLELIYLRDHVDAYLTHVQGSAIIKLADGHTIRIGYDGKNGHIYTSIGELLVERGEIDRRDMSLTTLREWLSADADRARLLMQENESFIFFREFGRCQDVDGPIGTLGAPLTRGRSLAIDAGVHLLGLPVFVVADGIRVGQESGVRRLMMAQDVGSAIKGEQRGDIFWGSGDGAGRIAGMTAHSGRFFVLRPNEIK